jgi:hypothetical protein
MRSVHHALPLMLLAVNPCGGRIESTGAGSGTAPPATSSTENGADAGAAHTASGACTDPIHVSLGQTISGSTCGGTPLPVTSICSQSGPVVFFYVDAPSGSVFRIDATPSISLVGYTREIPDGAPPECAQVGECAGGTTSVTFSPGLQLYSVQMLDTSNDSHTCGDFTITVTLSSCTANSQCVNGTACIMGTCRNCATNAQCGPTGVCSSGYCTCMNDAQCDTGQHCNIGACSGM